MSTVDATPCTLSARPVAPAYFVGTQECSGVVPDFDLWNLTADIEGHPVESTVSSDTLLALGYSLPAKPESAA